MTPEIRVVMTDLGLPEKSIKVGLEKGYEARVIDDMSPIAPGNVIWGMTRHLDAYEAYMDRQVIGAFEDAKRAVTIVASSADPDNAPLGPHEPLYTQAQLNDAIQQVRGEKSGQKAQVENSKGWESYERRVQGESWARIGPNSLNNAKAYAKARDLTWPIVASTQLDG